MLIPRRDKHRKETHPGRSGAAKGGTKVVFGEYGIQALEPAYVTNRQIESARIAMTRHIKRGGKVWINIYPDRPPPAPPPRRPPCPSRPRPPPRGRSVGPPTRRTCRRPAPRSRRRSSGRSRAGRAALAPARPGRGRAPRRGGRPPPW